MPAILFGSIGTVAETSELQRQAFNLAFKAHRLDWHWDREPYQALLIHSGGEQRIKAWARNQAVDAHAIHQTKSEIYQQLLTQSGLMPRPGVLETIRVARSRGISVGLVSATSPENVAQLLAALAPHLSAADFSLLTNSTLFVNRKPAPDAYLYALQTLGATANDCIAIEDNADGLVSALAAGVRCIAFPGANTADHDYSGAQKIVDHISFESLIALNPQLNSGKQ